MPDRNRQVSSTSSEKVTWAFSGGGSSEGSSQRWGQSPNTPNSEPATTSKSVQKNGPDRYDADPIKFDPTTPNTEQYYRQRSPCMEDSRPASRHRPESPPYQARYRSTETIQYRPQSPEPEGARGRKGGFAPEERGRGVHPRKRSRSPHLPYIPPRNPTPAHSPDAFYDRDYRVDPYQRGSYHYQREYISDNYGHRERNQSPPRVKQPPRQPLPEDGRYYDNLYLDSRYISEENIASRRERGRSRNPPTHRATAGSSSRDPPPPAREHKYGYARAPSHPYAPYYTYPPTVPTEYPFPEVGSHSRRRSRSRSPRYSDQRQLSPTRQFYGNESRGPSSSSSRYPTKLQHGHPQPQVPQSLSTRSPANYTGEEEYRGEGGYSEWGTVNSGRSYMSRDGGSEFPQRYHPNAGGYEDASRGRVDRADDGRH